MKSVTLFILLILFNTVYTQETDHKISKSSKKFITEVSKIIKEKSLFSDSLHWTEISDELAALSFGKSDSADHEAVINYFIQKLRNAGDNHSFFLTPAIKQSFLPKNSEPKQPESKYVGSGIGLIKVPDCITLSSTKDRDFANNIRSQIKKLDTEIEMIGWVIDLRNNGGGNMWPMVAGLNSLLPDGIVGYLIGRNNGIEKKWKTENGKINYSNEVIDTYKVKKMSNKIAVLIDSMTASSGEMTAITFIGLPNVKLIGQPSAGYTTVNSTFYLSDKTPLFLATNFVADRAHNIYLKKIMPDVIINTQNSLGNDETLANAINWILQTH
jgi:carboxyl-terminal processing protease